MGCTGSSTASTTRKTKTKGGADQKITFYSDPASQPCRSVEYILKKLGIVYKFQLTEVIKDTRTEAFKKINPNQKVPVLDHNGYKIQESTSIARYLCDTFDGGDALYPTGNLKDKARVDMWLDWYNTTARPSFVDPVRFIILYPKFFGKPVPSDERKKELMDELYKAVQALEDQLKANKWLAGKKVSIADHFNYTELITSKMFLQLDLKKYTKVTAWMEALEKDPIHKELTAAANERFAKM